MNPLRNVFASALAVTAAVLAPSAFAQELSREQQEVWQFIQTCNEHFANRDEAAILDCFHDDFSGWLYGDTVPRSKQSITKFLPFDLETENLAYDLRPISIRVFGDFAIVHYSLVAASRGSNGEVVWENMIWTDVMLKERGRWQWVGDHGGTVID